MYNNFKLFSGMSSAFNGLVPVPPIKSNPETASSNGDVNFDVHNASKTADFHIATATNDGTSNWPSEVSLSEAILVVNGKSQSQQKDGQSQLTNDNVSDELDSDNEVLESGSDDDDEERSGDLPFFDLTRRMYRLYVTTSNHSDENVVNSSTIDKSSMEKLRSQVNDLRHIAILMEEELAARKGYAPRLVQLGFVELCQHICVDSFSHRKGWSLASKAAASGSNAYHVAKRKLKCQALNFAIATGSNLTDTSPEACNRVIDIELYRNLFSMLKDDTMDPDRVEFSRAHNDLIDGIMTILYNVVQVVPEAREMYRDEDAVAILQKLRMKTADAVACMALILQSYVINEDENDLLGGNERSFSFLANELRDAVRSDDHRSNYGYRASELLEAINKLAIVEVNKKRIINSGAVSSYVRLVTDTELATDEEQLSAVSGLWWLASDKKCPENAQAIRDQPGCIDGLKKLLANADKENLRRQIFGALEALGEKVTDLQLCDSRANTSRVAAPKVTISPLSFVGHVFISYNHGSKATCLRLRDRLKAAGYSVWIDADFVSESIVGDIIKGLDEAAVVLVCMTQKYYESQYCQKEVVYSVESHKEIIPLILEPRYKPHGWLKFLISDRLRLDFSRDDVFEDSFKKLHAMVKKIFEITALKTTDFHDGNVPQVVTSELNCRPPPAAAAAASAPAPYAAGRQSDHYEMASAAAAAAAAADEIESWTSTEVKKWIAKSGLQHLTEWFSDYDGEMLLELKRLRNDSPETFAACMQNEIKSGRLSVKDLLKLTKALRQI